MQLVSCIVDQADSSTCPLVYIVSFTTCSEPLDLSLSSVDAQSVVAVVIVLS